MESSIYNYNSSNSYPVDSISENITCPEANMSTTLINSNRVTTVPVNNQTSDSTTFVTKLVSIFKRIISVAETATNFINAKFNALLDAIKQLKPNIENNHFKFKVANFRLVINKPVYIINY